MLANLLMRASQNSALFDGLQFSLANPNVYGNAANDFFGYSVAISGTYCIIGAYGEANSSGASSGRVYIYNVTTGALLRSIANPNAYSTGTNDFFGFSVDISGNYCIVGAYKEGDAGGNQSGKAYIFDVISGALLFTLANPNSSGTSAGDNFGYSVAISGNYCIVGAPNEDTGSHQSSGSIYIFNVTTGAKLFTITDPNTHGNPDNDYFGFSVDISGNYCIAGAYGEDFNGFLSGSAHIFNVTTGAKLFTLNDPNAYGTGNNDYFGYSVSISGNYCIVGAYNEKDAGGGSSGKAYIFDVTTGNLTQILNNPNAYGTSANDYFGYSVEISGNYCIVGAYNEKDAGGSASGKAYIFDIMSGSNIKTLDNPNVYGTSANDYFGCSVDISGAYCVVGAYGEDIAGNTLSGEAYIFS